MKSVKVLVLFSLAYGAMLPMVAAHVMFNWKVLKYEGYTSVEQLKKCGPRVDAYTKTIPFQPIYNVLVFGLISFANFRGLTYLELLKIGAFWLLLAFVTDIISWILIPHPWQLSLKELFIGHQPWISLCYLCIFVSPLISVVQ